MSREREFREATGGEVGHPPMGREAQTPTMFDVDRRLTRVESFLRGSHFYGRPVTVTPNENEAQQASAPVSRVGLGGQSILEHYANLVARDVEQGSEQGPGQEGVERAEIQRAGFLDILTAVVSIFMGIMEKCPLSKGEAADAIRKPNDRQRSALYREIMRYTGPLRIRKQREIFRSMLARGESMPEAHALAIVDEASNDQNLLF